LREKSSVEWPEIEQIKRVDYHRIDNGGDWELKLLVHYHGVNREFLYRKKGILLPEEEKRLYSWCHGWWILRIRGNHKD
jgi:hypothetical protein